MKKALGSWSGMRKYLEDDMLAENLRGRIRYNCTSYIGMDGCRIFELFIDGRLFKQFSLETVNTYFTEMKYVKKQSPMSIRDYWDDFGKLMAEYPMDARTEYTDEEFCSALEKYRGSDITESLHSADPIIKMFALMDRRTGKRTLDALQGEIGRGPEWLKRIYMVRTGRPTGGGN